MVTRIDPNQRSGFAKPSPYQKETAEEPKKPIDSKRTRGKTDTVVIRNAPEAPVTYAEIANKKQLSASDIAALKALADQANENLRRLVEELILKQNKNYQLSRAEFTPHEKVSIDDIEQAKLAISEDGEFGVKAVSDKLVNFAISISGGDKSKYEELRAAIEEGFAAAKEALGGYLPDICIETYHETMRKLEAWAMGE
ncbi:MAG TPA: hypothetical protein PKG53_02720 [Bacillota bacterium]|jgi:hypothetical protein|nr:hypothetical protein [Bacillota bacterium]